MRTVFNSEPQALVSYMGHPCFISKGGPCMKQVPVFRTTFSYPYYKKSI